MNIRDDEAGDEHLKAHGDELAALLTSSSFGAVASSYGYAVALGRPLEEAIRGDLAHALAEVGASTLATETPVLVDIVRFESTSGGPIAVVECRLASDNGRAVLAELVLTDERGAKHVTLEQISATV